MPFTEREESNEGSSSGGSHAAAEGEESQQRPFLGKRVRLFGLVGRDDLNGSVGEAIIYDADWANF